MTVIESIGRFHDATFRPIGLIRNKKRKNIKISIGVVRAIVICTLHNSCQIEKD